MYNIEYFNSDNIENCNQYFTKVHINSITQKILKSEDYYKVLLPVNIEDILTSCIKYAQIIKNNFKNLVIIGMGGAELNPRSMLSLVKKSNNKNYVDSNFTSSDTKIYFLNNTDPYYFIKLFSKINIKHTAFLVISNSGETIETISLCGAVVSEFYRHNIYNNIGKFFFIITNNNASSLFKFATKINATIIEHERNISGRYSGFTNVNIIAGLVANLNMYEYLNGANNILQEFIDNQENSIVVHSANFVLNAKKNIMVNIGYLQRFKAFLEWNAQIIAESLGKSGQGYTPIYGIGPNDQHSTMQLYLDGPKDKIFSMFYIKEFSSYTIKDIIINKVIDENQGSHINISSKSLEEINKLNYDATILALQSKGISVRKFLLDDLSEKTIGSITAHFMLETILLAHAINVNPFNQPGVEAIKTKLKKML